MYVWKLEKLDGSCTEIKNIPELNDGFTDEDYDNDICVHSEFFDDLVHYFRVRKRDLDKKAIFEKRQRRFKTPGEEIG